MDPWLFILWAYVKCSVRTCGTGRGLPVDPEGSTWLEDGKSLPSSPYPFLSLKYFFPFSPGLFASVGPPLFIRREGWAPSYTAKSTPIFKDLSPWKINLEWPQFVYNVRSKCPNPGGSLQGCAISTPLLFLLVLEIQKKVNFFLSICSHNFHDLKFKKPSISILRENPYLFCRFKIHLWVSLWRFSIIMFISIRPFSGPDWLLGKGCLFTNSNSIEIRWTK